MKAVVLAAGVGSRLGELTADTAKPALTVGERPLVAHVVAHLARCGFRQIAVNIHYRADQIRDALGDGRVLGVEIEYFPEDELLGTAGALRPMAGFLAAADAFVVQYADVLTDHDLGGMLERHRQRDALLTLLVHERRDSNSVVAIDEDRRIVDFVERPEPGEPRPDSSWVNSGVYACSPDLLGLVPEPPSDLARDVVPRAVATGRAFADPLSGFRCAVDSPERLEQARAALRDGRWRPALD